MRIADVDAFVQPREEWLKKELKKKHNEEYRRGYLEGVRVTLFELGDERLAPTVEAVPIDELIRLRDVLYGTDGITMRGLAMLNGMIQRNKNITTK